MCRADLSGPAVPPIPPPQPGTAVNIPSERHNCEIPLLCPFRSQPGTGWACPRGWAGRARPCPPGRDRGVPPTPLGCPRAPRSRGWRQHPWDEMETAAQFPAGLSPALPIPAAPPGAGAQAGREQGRKLLTRVLGFGFEHHPERSTKY